MKEKLLFVGFCILHTSTSLFLVVTFLKEATVLSLSLWGDSCLCHFLHSWSLPSCTDPYVCCFWSFLLVSQRILSCFLHCSGHRCLLMLIPDCHPILLLVLMICW